MTLAVCATPIGNLDDVTLRVLAELREADSCSPRTRATRAACCSATESRRNSSFYHELTSLTRGGAPAADRRQASGSHSCRTRGLRASPTRCAFGASGARCGCRGDSSARCVGGRDGAGRKRPRVGALRVRRLPAASRAELTALWAELAGWRWPVVAFDRRSGWASLRLAGGGDAGARRGRAPRADEEVRRSRARNCRVARGALFEPPKGEITIVLGPAELAPAGRSRCGGRGRAGCGGTPRKVAVEVVSRLTDMSRNDLYRGSL